MIPRTLNPQFHKAIKEVLAEDNFTPKGLAKQIDDYCERKGIQVLTACKFLDNRYEIVVGNLMPFESMRSLAAEMNLTFQPTGNVDVYVMSSAVGLKLIAKIRNGEPLLNVSPVPTNYTIEASDNWLTRLAGSRKTLNLETMVKGLLNYLEKHKETKLRKEAAAVITQIEDAVDEATDRIEHEAKILYDDVAPLLEHFTSIADRIEALPDAGGLKSQMAALRQHVQDRIRMPLVAGYTVIKRLTEKL